MKKNSPFKVALSPPWITFENQVKFTVGQDPNVRVRNLKTVGSNFILPITVLTLSRARALATIIQNSVQLGNITVTVRIKTKAGKLAQPFDTTSLTASQIARLYRIAFSTNTLFDFVTTRSLIPGDPASVFPVFKKRVVQFFNDDLSDLFSNFNNVAAFVFQAVLKNTINNIAINFSTTEK